MVEILRAIKLLFLFAAFVLALIFIVRWAMRRTKAGVGIAALLCFFMFALIASTGGSLSGVAPPKGSVGVQAGKQDGEASYKEKCSELDYAALARNPDKYKGELFTFTGKVSMNYGRVNSNYILLVGTEENAFGVWENPVFVVVNVPRDADAILNDDIIEVWGECGGRQELFTAIMGSDMMGGVAQITAKYYTVDN